ncbi:MAG: hypothetical protein P8Y82_08095, partial [Methyloceanibacter sp.]
MAPSQVFRQAYQNRRSFSDLTLYVNLSAMGLHDRAGHGQAKPQTFVIGLRGIPGPPEAFEYIVQIFLRDSDALVG